MNISDSIVYRKLDLNSLPVPPPPEVVVGVSFHSSQHVGSELRMGFRV